MIINIAGIAKGRTIKSSCTEIWKYRGNKCSRGEIKSRVSVYVRADVVCALTDVIWNTWTTFDRPFGRWKHYFSSLLCYFLVLLYSAVSLRFNVPMALLGRRTSRYIYSNMYTTESYTITSYNLQLFRELRPRDRTKLCGRYPGGLPTRASSVKSSVKYLVEEITFFYSVAI